MKSMKGRFFRTLKFLPGATTMKQGFVSTEKFPNQNLQISTVYMQEDQKHMTEPKHEEGELELNVGAKEKITPSVVFNVKVPTMDNSEHPVPSDITKQLQADNEVEKDKAEYPLLSDFEEKCPPVGHQSIVLYTTSLRSIRKTFEDCQTIRFLLESFKVIFDERDVSMHLEFRKELWSILGGRVIPPRIFIRGRYIGGADEMVSLHEQGKLKKLLEGIPRTLSNRPCTGCGNMKFVICDNCNGSGRIFADGENDEMRIRCIECNENGLVKCPICS